MDANFFFQLLMKFVLGFGAKDQSRIFFNIINQIQEFALGNK